jgi:hypothetical protein
MLVLARRSVDATPNSNRSLFARYAQQRVSFTVFSTMLTKKKFKEFFPKNIAAL